VTHPLALDFSPVVFWLLIAPLAFAAAAAASYWLIGRMMPLLQRYALARPNARSSHHTPTPQGGGIAVILTTLLVSALVIAGMPDHGAIPMWHLGLVAIATVGIAAVGAIDDIHTIAVAPRLLLQCCAVTIVVAALPAELTLGTPAPWWLERAIMLIAGIWFVNLVNFMDGIDWMMAAEIVPIALVIAVIGALLGLAPAVIVVSLVLAGAMAGFAPFNRPVAALFLGDVGSLPIGLLLGWLLLMLATGGALAAAVILPLYFLADATLTLLRRLVRGERIWEAHRSHFYQRATDNGFSVMDIVRRVFCLNLALAALALLSVLVNSAAADLAAVVIAAALVGWLLASFTRPRRAR
jgi:UDP-N-acetylmuramyl pentapeptide phosphotransferase/UDP-N-acetylglucosamine-1-phosphate transferase